MPVGPEKRLRQSWRSVLHRPSRWLLAVAWLSIVAECVVAATFLLTGSAPRSGLHGPADHPQGRGVAGILNGTVPSGDAVDRTARVQAVRDVLARRSRAILTRDRAGFLATVDPAAPGLRARQAAVFGNLAGVPFASWRYRLNPDAGAALPPGVAEAYGDRVWAPEVQLEYALAGYDPVPTSQQRRYLFVQSGPRWYIADDGLAPQRHAVGSGSVRNLWDFGPVHVMRGSSVLVLGHPGSERLMRGVLSLAEQAVPSVSEVWGDWRRRAVILVPDSAEELGHLVEEAGDLSGMAAFTSADVPHAGPPVGKRIVVNPAAFRKLSPFGRRVVLTHEVTHVATRHVTSRHTPYWLAEGFADYVAYRNTGVRLRRAARELAHDVRAGEVPERLPEWSDFTTANPRLAQAYQESWLACRLIVERGGEATLVRLYRRLSRAGGDPSAALDVAMRDELGIGEAGFTDAWRRYLRTQLHDD